MVVCPLFSPKHSYMYGAHPLGTTEHMPCLDVSGRMQNYIFKVQSPFECNFTAANLGEIYISNALAGLEQP